MFSSRGFFKDVPCPGRHDCTLPNCLFRHELSQEHDSASGATQVYDPASCIPSEPPPPAKRRKLDDSAQVSQNGTHVRQPVVQGETLVSSIAKDMQSHNLQPNQRPLKRALPDSTEDNHEFASHDVSAATQVGSSLSTKNVTHPTKVKQPMSVTRAVSPPTVARAQTNGSSPTKPYRRPVKSKGLIPRTIEKDPLKFSDRHSLLKKLHKQIEEANNRYRKDFPQRPELFLNKEELETQALDDEERIANASPSIDAYKIALGHRAAFYTAKKMSSALWQGFVTETWLTNPNNAILPLKPGPKKIESGLNTSQEIVVLKHLRTGLQQYAKFGYITKAPTESEVAAAKKFQDSDAGSFEVCDRCSSRFQVFRGRSSDGSGRLTSGGSCYYHWGRIPMSKAMPKGSYPCCGQGSGSTGCSISEHHVFKTSDPARLSAVLTFEKTPKPDDGKVRSPIVFDCEMSYTTLGLELIRLTALSWPSKTTVIDVLVRPVGEILDFNTRFSGVSPELYVNAPNWGEDNKFPKYRPGEPLYRVAGPKAARSLLFDRLDPETPLIGHAIDNDLNACRVIHPFVIDTVLLYPHPKGLPIRFKLRDLARMHLDRSIQTGGSEGHDSKEDSEATGDLVLVKVKERWDDFKRRGWYWDGDNLMVKTTKTTVRTTPAVLSSP